MRGMDFERTYRLYFKDVFLYLRALSAPEIHITHTAGGSRGMQMRSCLKMSRIYSRILPSGLRTKRAPFRSTGFCTAWTNPIKKYLA